MGIKTVKYKANSIVYFKGDIANRVYILKKGSIVTKTTDLKSNEDVLTMIKVGEFIGVKNVISNQPYSETVSTLTDSELLVFYKEDFEKFILGNNRIMMQTLVVFSNQLRKIHKDIKELNELIEHVHKPDDAEKDLFELGVYFKKQNKMEYSNYCFKQYKENYPNGKFLDQIANGSSYSSYDSFGDDLEISMDEEEDVALDLQEGKNYFEEENYSKAYECFSKILESPDPYHEDETLYYAGICLYKLGKFKKCIRNYSSFLSKYKSFKKINDVMFYVGMSYKQIGDAEQAKRFLGQVVKRASSTNLAKLAHREMRDI